MYAFACLCFSFAFSVLPIPVGMFGLSDFQRFHEKYVSRSTFAFLSCSAIVQINTICIVLVFVYVMGFACPRVARAFSQIEFACVCVCVHLRICVCFVRCCVARFR